MSRGFRRKGHFEPPSPSASPVSYTSSTLGPRPASRTPPLLPCSSAPTITSLPSRRGSESSVVFVRDHSSSRALQFRHREEECHPYLFVRSPRRPVTPSTCDSVFSIRDVGMCVYEAKGLLSDRGTGVSVPLITFCADLPTHL